MTARRPAQVPDGVGMWSDRSDRIDHDAPVNLWAQVAADLETRMDGGDLPPGSRLPSNVELAEVYGVARVTVQRAVLELRRQGRLVVVTGRGTYVQRV